MMIAIYILLGLLALIVVAYYIFRSQAIASIGRGGVEVRKKIMDGMAPLTVRLRSGEVVTAEEVEAWAAQPKYRCYLVMVLENVGKMDLFPQKYFTTEAHAESELVQWMMHPHEYGEPPAAIELEECVSIAPDEPDLVCYVFRFKMPEGHWQKEWMMGVAGPVSKSDPPYEGEMGAFSRGDTLGKMPPTALVAWWMSQ